MTLSSGWRFIGLLLVLCVSGASVSFAQAKAAPADATRATEVSAGEADAEKTRRKLVKNEFNLGFTTLHVGAGLLFDVVTYAQDAASEAQIDAEPDVKLRDFRFLLNGRFTSQRRMTWQLGLMWDGASDSWMFRMTGIMVAVPELWGNLFIGRTKEGISESKVQSGYDIPGMERLHFGDATLPILADGIKWLGYLPNRKLFWNIGYYNDVLSEGQGFSTYEQQFVTRVGWLPMVSDTTVLHIAASIRTGTALNGQLRVRSRPEAHPAPYFVDTGTFPAQSSFMTAVEVFYRPGSWLFGMEYLVQQVNSPTTGDPTFHGGEIFAAWIITGETRAYNSAGGYFKAVSPAKTVFEGGPGAWEAMLRFTFSDLDDGTLQGGKFWRFTPMVNWHLTDVIRLELVYGYGKLDRFDLEGVTQFFQSRVQIKF